MLGSIVYLGIIAAGFGVGTLYRHFQSKLVCLIGLSGMCVTLLMFMLSNQIWLAMLSRFLTGSCQVFLLVYFPVWIDKFGGEKATLWITLLQVGVPLGIFAGYGMTSVIVYGTGKVLIWCYAVAILILLADRPDSGVHDRVPSAQEREVGCEGSSPAFVRAGRTSDDPGGQGEEETVLWATSVHTAQK